ncbi:zinc-binding dehydrogenase [Nonomuraea sp. LPB2021202275-12-8]|uniref:zinc-binding dehydrogenase n=1 Tax=Nonomuraea sp. LPB2021202275-12-8 TaxID=3120159 RepID=UPI00300CA452
MRAIHVREFGGPEVLTPVEIPDPVPGPGEVVVDLAAADIIYLDTLLRAGWGADFFPKDLPYVPGGGGAGTVSAVGEGADPAWIGRRVVARSATGYAERITASLREVVEIPDGLGFPEAAAILHDGVTALLLAHDGAIRKGERVLVTAAAGGAGSILVQLGREAGARVTAAARGERKLALARELGAETVVDYSLEGWQRQVEADLVFDGVGGALGEAAFEATVEGGRFITYGTAGGEFTHIDPALAERRRVGVHNALEAGPPEQDKVRAVLAQALDLAAKGTIRPAIGATFPLERARDAHVSLAERATAGKSLLLI